MKLFDTAEIYGPGRSEETSGGDVGSVGADLVYKYHGIVAFHLTPSVGNL